MRPQSKPYVLACALAGALIAACGGSGSDGRLGPGGPGSGGARAGAGGGPTPPAGGASGSHSSGPGGNIPTGAGGDLSTGTGGILSTGTGGILSTGSGGIISTGAGGGGAAAGNGPGGTGGRGGGDSAGGRGGSVGGGGGDSAGGRGGSGGGGGGDSAGGRGGSSGARCGNGVRDMELFERCDGEDLAGETCQSVRGFPSGTLGCSPSTCVFDTSRCSPCTKDPVVIRCGLKPTDLSLFAAALGSNGTEVALALATATEASAGRMRFSRLNAALDTISTVTVNEPGVRSLGYGSVNAFSVAPLPSGWVVAGVGPSNIYVHTFDAAGANVGRITVKVMNGILTRLVVVPRPDGGPLVLWGTDEAGGYALTNIYAALVSADGASTTAAVVVSSGADILGEIGRGTYADGQFYVPFTRVTDADMVGHLEIARVSTTGTLTEVVDALPGVDVRSPALVTAGGQLVLSYRGNADGSPFNPYAQNALFSLRLERSGAAASSSPPLVLADRATPGPLLTVGDGVFQLLDESNVPVGPAYLGEALELVRVPADGPLGEKHQLLAAGYLPDWLWLDAVSVGSDVVIAFLEGGEGPLQLLRARP